MIQTKCTVSPGAIASVLGDTTVGTLRLVAVQNVEDERVLEVALVQVVHVQRYVVAVLPISEKNGNLGLQVRGANAIYLTLASN